MEKFHEHVVAGIKRLKLCFKQRNVQSCLHDANVTDGLKVILVCNTFVVCSTTKMTVYYVFVSFYLPCLSILTWLWHSVCVCVRACVCMFTCIYSYPHFLSVMFELLSSHSIAINLFPVTCIGMFNFIVVFSLTPSLSLPLSLSLSLSLSSCLSLCLSLLYIMHTRFHLHFLSLSIYPFPCVHYLRTFNLYLHSRLPGAIQHCSICYAYLFPSICLRICLCR